MYYYLIGALKRRLILELQDSFSKHPLYSKIVPYIQNKFAFTERPQFGIVVKGSSGNKVQLSADNFLGIIQSHVMLAQVDAPAFPLEWVREDLACVGQNGGMPTAPGVYYLEVLEAPPNAQDPGKFIIDPLLTVTDEAVLLFQSGIEREAQLQQIPIQGTLRIWSDHDYMLRENYDYTVDYGTGAIQLLSRFERGQELSADYRYAGTSVGPVDFYWNTANQTTLPGVVMAFGKRAQLGDKVAIVVYPDRVSVAQAFGGKFEASFDLDVISRDTIQMEEIADLVVMYLWAQKRPVLSFEGIEILDVSMGGESEELYDETGDMYFYQASMSVQIQADWEIHMPLPLTISRATLNTHDGDTNPSLASGMSMMANSLFYFTYPGRNRDFERIG